MDADRAADKLIGGESARPSEACEEFIKGWEKCRLKRYLDSAGRPTIGWGHLMHEGDDFLSCTQVEADSLFLLDLLPTADAVARLIFMPLLQHQFDALVSFAFNLGAGALAGSTLRKRVNGGYFDQAADEFGQWIRVRDPSTGELKDAPGIIKRRAAERAIFEFADYSGRP